MITIAVTGSSGKLGRHVVRDLHEHGYRTVALDRVPDPDSMADVAVRVDLTDHGQVIEALTAVDDRYDGVDAVVHLAAIPAPGLTTNAATFANNITTTYKPSSRGEFHPPALTDPYVNLSVHTALVVLVTRLWGRSWSRPSARSTVVVL
jgi:NAD(P)-dependent dehydrogenase (short-subunit alcohol dehydrogenase family)